MKEMPEHLVISTMYDKPSKLRKLMGGYFFYFHKKSMSKSSDYCRLIMAGLVYF